VGPFLLTISGLQPFPSLLGLPLFLEVIPIGGQIACFLPFPRARFLDKLCPVKNSVPLLQTRPLPFPSLRSNRPRTGIPPPSLITQTVLEYLPTSLLIFVLAMK